MDSIYAKVLKLLPVLNQLKAGDLIRFKQGSLEHLTEIYLGDYPGSDLFVQTDDGHTILFRDISFYDNGEYTEKAYQDLSYFCLEPLELWSKIDDQTYKCIWKEGK